MTYEVLLRSRDYTNYYLYNHTNLKQTLYYAQYSIASFLSNNGPEFIPAQGRQLLRKIER